MAYTVFLQTPDAPIREELSWTTDLATSYDGSEDRIPLNRYPKRIFSGTYSFDDVSAARRHMASMFRLNQGEFDFPLFQYMVKLKNSVSAGSNTVSVNSLRSDFRVGRKAVISDGSKYEIRTVASVAANSVTFTSNLANGFGKQAYLCPVTSAYTAAGAAFNRMNPDGTASASFTYSESDKWTPFLSHLNTSTVDTFDSKPVLDIRAKGNQFDMSLTTGISITDYIGPADVFSPWLQSQWTMNLVWHCNRTFDLSSWLWWMAFADQVQGSFKPFLLPTQRSDLEVVDPAVGAGNAVTVEGSEYSQHYFSLDTFKRIVIDSDAGRHYALVTGISSVSGNDRLTFSPALPNTIGWTVNQRVEFMLKVHIADDKILIDHYDLYSDIAMSVRTVS